MSHDRSNERPAVDAENVSTRKLIMLAVDGSEQATWAAQAAAGLAEPLGAEIVLVHVMNTEAVGASELAFTEAEMLATLRRNADAIFATARAEIPLNVRVQRLLREGDPAKEIIASAVEWDADLVVMGTHGRGRLGTFLLGSTAEAVIRGSPCPVATVAHPRRGTTPPAPVSRELASVVL